MSEELKVFERDKAIYHEQWSDENYPIKPEEDDAYKAGWHDGWNAYAEQQRASLQEIREAYTHAIGVIRTWHDLDTDGQRSLWLIYQNSPEMKQINAGLATLNKLIDEQKGSDDE